MLFFQVVRLLFLRRDLMVVGSSSKSNSVTEEVHQLDAWISGHVQGFFQSHYREGFKTVFRNWSCEEPTGWPGLALR